MFSFSGYFLTALEATLSMRLNTVLKPIFVRYLMFYMNVAIIEISIKYFSGVSNITFDDQSYIINIAVFLYIDLIGKFPAKSTYIIPFFRFRVAWYAKR